MALNIIYILTLLSSTILSFRFWDCLKSRKLHFFGFLLLYIFINELYCNYAVETFNASTGWNYNVLTIIDTSFLAIFYARLAILKRYRYWIWSGLIIYLLAALVTFAFIDPITDFSTHLFLGAALLLVFCGLFFVFEYFQLDDPVNEKELLPVVWITAGIVMFFSVTSITFTLYNTLVSYNVTVMGLKLHQLIPQLVSIFRYGCFAIGFYLCRKKI